MQSVWLINTVSYHKKPIYNYEMYGKIAIEKEEVKKHTSAMMNSNFECYLVKNNDINFNCTLK